MLSEFLVSEIFGFLLIFCRIGAAMMLMPGFGESYVSPQFRIIIALFFSMIITPMIEIPPVPGTTFGLVNILVAETLVGGFIGGLGRLLLSAVHMAGTIIAMQSSLASILTQDVTQIQGQSSAISNFMAMTALLLIFSLNLHHLMLQSLVDSYTLFLPGTFPPVSDFATHASKTLDSSFDIAIQLSAPHIVVSIILNLGAAVLARLTPQIQVFFLMMAPQILLSIFIFMISFSTVMLIYIDYFRNSYSAFLSP